MATRLPHGESFFLFATQPLGRAVYEPYRPIYDPSTPFAGSGDSLPPTMGSFLRPRFATTLAPTDVLIYIAQRVSNFKMANCYTHHLQ